MDSQERTRASMGSYDRKLRYRALLEDLSALDDEGQSNVETIRKTAKVVEETNSLLNDGVVEERVRHPGEGYLDSKVLLATSGLTIRCSEAVSGNVNTYDKDDLAQHVRENPEYWDFSLPKCAPILAFLHGAFEPTPPELAPTRPRRRVERQPATQLKEPENVEKLEKVEEGSEMVARVHKFIQREYKNSGNRPISYFHCVVDPDSFSRTVENMYHVSYLVRDGVVAIHLDDEFGLPFITPVSSSKRESQSQKSDENQFVISTNMEVWQRLIEVFDIRKPMMVLKRL